MLPSDYCNLHFEKTIKSWDEALPLGNGFLGALVWGESGALRLSLDKSDLWDCTGALECSGDFSYEGMKKFVKAADQKKIVETFDEPYFKPTPTKLPAGKIIIDLKEKSNLVSSLDISVAEALVETKKTRLNTFLSAHKNVGYIKISSGDCVFKIDNPEYGLKSERKKVLSKRSITQSLKNLQYERPDKSDFSENGIEYKYFLQKVNEKLSYGIFLAVKRENKSIFAVYTVSSGKNADEIIKSSINLLNDALAEGYEAAFNEHRKWWNGFYSKSHISLEDKYFEKNWYLCNYLLASCSRKGGYPMPLQGVWTADNGELPPWKGDYHHDLNTELSYYSYLKANHLEEGESFTDYLFSLFDKGKAFARDFFARDGLCLPSVMDLEGNALGGWAMYSLSPTNQAWLCRAFEQHFDYTQDMDFLRNTAYPFLLESGKLLAGLLEKDKDGKLVLPLSASPEIHDNSLNAWLTPNSHYDLALMKSLFSSIVRFSELLEKKDNTSYFSDILASLDDFAVDSDGVFMLSRDERLNESHRHLAHVMAIHPLRLINYEKIDEKRIIDASIKNLEELGTEYFCGYSFAWLAELYAVQKNGNKAYETLDKFFRYFCLPNGFHCNGDYTKQGFSNFTYRPFTLEGNFCAADALQEMLLYSDSEKIEICPAIPETWKNLSFSLLCIGNIFAEVEIAQGKLTKLTLSAKTPATRQLIFGEKSVIINIQSGETVFDNIFTE